MNTVLRKCPLSVKKKNTTQVVLTALDSTLFSHIFIRSSNLRKLDACTKRKLQDLSLRKVKTSFSVNKLLLKTLLKPRPNDRNIQRNIRPNIVGSCCDLLRRAGQTHATSRNNLRNFSEYLWPPVSCRLNLGRIS